MNVGVTGHQRLDNNRGWQSIRAQISSVLSRFPTPVGLSSLAVGADQLFAFELLRHGGSLVAVIPFPDYESGFSPAARDDYLQLVAKASVVIPLPWQGSDAASYANAGKYIVDHCDLLVAVWDGHPALDQGGTGSVVEYALEVGVPVEVLDASRWRT